jgi:hypothetical protein
MSLQLRKDWQMRLHEIKRLLHNTSPFKSTILISSVKGILTSSLNIFILKHQIISKVFMLIYHTKFS